MTPRMIRRLTEVTDSYDGILLDAFGVLRDGAGLLPGAKNFLDHLSDTGKDFLIVTNGAKYHPKLMVSQYQKFGVDCVTEDRILSSGSLLRKFIEKENLVGRPCAVIGPEESRDYIRSYGAKVVGIREDFEALIIGNQDNFRYPEDFDLLFSKICQLIDQGETPKLILPNPDMIYPKKDGQFGFTVGSIALVLEEALGIRYGEGQYQFLRLGKPYLPIYEAAAQKMGSMNLLMVGDQEQTDIRGAKNFGIDSALMLTGLTKIEDKSQLEKLSATYVVPRLI